MIYMYIRAINYFRILFYSVLIFTNIPTYSQWFQQESSTDVHLNSVFFLDSLNGWIVGLDSTILKTTNGGEDWNSLPSGFNYNFNDIYFTSDSVGWIVGDGVLLYTSNGGQSWLKQSDNSMRGLYAISFVNEKIGYLSGGGITFPGAGIILKTENGGVTWDTVYITNYPMGDNFYDIDFVNPQVGWAVGGVVAGWGYIIIKTTDGGETWIDQTPSINYWAFYGCDFVSENEGWIASIGNNNYEANLYTKDGGSNWESQTFPDSTPYVYSICFIDDNTGWCGHREIYHTTDKGNIWTKQSHPIISEVFFTSIFFVDNNLGWVVGTDGIILKTTNGGVSFVEEKEINETPTDYSLSNNYPNPFNPSTKIKYSVPQSSQIVIKVFDVLGNEIETLVNEKKIAGTYELTWYAEGLPSGIYFYQLQTNKLVETKKMILLK